MAGCHIGASIQVSQPCLWRSFLVQHASTHDFPLVGSRPWQPPCLGRGQAPLDTPRMLACEHARLLGSEGSVATQRQPSFLCFLHSKMRVVRLVCGLFRYDYIPFLAVVCKPSMLCLLLKENLVFYLHTFILNLD